jgi:4-hydroxybenzoate polyprenyltransferase
MIYLYYASFLSKWGLKECIGGILYASGILLIPYLHHDAITSDLHIHYGQLSLIAIINLVVFSYFDLEADQLGFGSITIVIGARRTKMLIYLLGLFSLILSIYLLQLGHGRIQLFYLVSSCVLLSMILFEPYYRKHEIYRYIGDGLFIIPVLL